MASRLDNLLLLFVVVASLPLATLLLWLNYAAVILASQRSKIPFRKLKSTPKKTILVTGTANAQGLNIARALERAGHRLIGADLQSLGHLDISRRSRALTKHYALPPLSAAADASYFARWVLEIVTRENVDLWIDCSHDIPLDAIALTRERVEGNTRCACIAADRNSSRYFKDKETLLEFFRGRNLPAPEMHRVRSRGDIHNVLNHGQGQKQYLLKSPMKSKLEVSQTLLPRRTLSQTYQDVSLVKITPGSSLILEEYLDSSTKYQCTAIAIRGSVEAFWVKRILASGVDVAAGGPALQQALRSYTEAVVRELGHDFSCHLTLSFVLSERITHAGVAQLILPVEGSLRLHPTFVPTAGLPGSSSLAETYLSMLRSVANGMAITSTPSFRKHVTNSKTSQPIKESYFLPDTISDLFWEPCKGLLLLRVSPREVLGSIGALTQKLLLGREAYYDFWDPVPAFWQYTIVLAWRVLVGTT
ncbi:hypothetical protein H2198_001011 [Neophaeococcomyces mojaviensis]|uniref:Uncharacterized protein n=1 Tax=Neophaeococcomyces mojaviensis TaxID=3383035 RepID=A0ACC3AIM7_9EURO|nr:hypothetical protein H2198_001011 [Knufia sp. JES_112]